MAEENSRAMGIEVSHLIASKIKPIEDVIINLASTLKHSEITADTVVSITENVVSAHEGIFGTAIAFEPYAMYADTLYFSPYSFRSGSGVETKMLGSTDYRYFYQDWYQLPKHLGRGVWTEPYFDSGGGEILMATFAVPFYHASSGGKNFAGVVTADISLSWLQDYISGLSLYDTGYAVLMSGRGLLLHHPNSEYVLNETIFSIAEENNDPQLWNIGKDAISGGTGFLERISYQNQEPSFFYYRPLPVGDWSLAFLFPHDEVLAEVTKLIRKNLILSLLGFVVLSLAITWLAGRFTKPLIKLSMAAREITRGHLGASVPRLRNNDELGQLSRSFSEMQQSLNRHIDQLAETRAQKERMESELRIARNIQMSILPKLFPPFPERNEFDIFAFIEPAREIGGDLYDFFFVDEYRFCFLVGDVSDKGVPAALFMAVTKTLLKVLVDQHSDPGTILQKVNEDLVEGNESCMFVTLFLAILDLRTGRIKTGNAGHNVPILQSGNNCDFLPSPKEPIAGAIPGLQYSTAEYQLDPGDTMLLYTDGVTEAADRENMLFGESRLLQEFNALLSCSPQEIVGNLKESIMNFSADVQQADDITLLCIRFNEKHPVALSVEHRT